MNKSLLILSFTAALLPAVSCSKTEKDSSFAETIGTEAVPTLGSVIEKALRDAISAREDGEQFNYAIYDHEADSCEVVNNFIYQLTDYDTSEDEDNADSWTKAGSGKSDSDIPTIAKKIEASVSTETNYAIRIGYNRDKSFDVAFQVIE
jgi:hypothetical protein